jgi:hypothetical protein
MLLCRRDLPESLMGVPSCSMLPLLPRGAPLGTGEPPAPDTPLSPGEPAEADVPTCMHSSTCHCLP